MIIYLTTRNTESPQSKQSNQRCFYQLQITVLSTQDNASSPLTSLDAVSCCNSEQRGSSALQCRKLAEFGADALPLNLCVRNYVTVLTSEVIQAWMCTLSSTATEHRSVERSLSIWTIMLNGVMCVLWRRRAEFLFRNLISSL